MTRESGSVRFDGEVAIVTGAAGSIGFSIASELARRGAAVVLNDPGTSVHGDGENASRVELAAEKIRALGGRAIANSVLIGTPASARALVEHAKAAFGEVDILVNAAGIARPASFAQATDENLAHEIETNLLGPYALMRAVWPAMIARGHGRILNVSSNAALGIGSNASYATAKAGLIGLTLDAAAEGKSRGIHVNAVMPVAYSRMIEGIPDPTFVDWFRNHMPAEKVAAVSVYFLSRECSISGQIFSTGGGRLARVLFAGNEGVVLEASAEAVRDHLEQALDKTHIRPIDSSADELAGYARVFPFSRGTPALQEEAVIGAGKHDRAANRDK